MTQPDSAAEEREQLEVVLGLIQDVNHEIASDFRNLARVRGSSEQYVYGTAVRTALAKLQFIAERRLQGRCEASDSSLWSELVVKVVSGAKQLKELVGKYGGLHRLTRLVERLPSLPPGSQANAVSSEDELVESGSHVPGLAVPPVGRNADSNESDEMARSASDKSGRGRALIARNIDRLRKECGWSYDQLAGATGIGKKLVLSHVHEKHKPNPKTLKEYAQAFSKQLKRSITANNLEE